MSRIVIDYRNPNSKQKVKELLNDWLASDQTEELKIQLIHVVSGDFDEDFDLDDVTDYNGWQCDWWHNMEYEGYMFKLFGEAWYCKILITT